MPYKLLSTGDPGRMLSAGAASVLSFFMPVKMLAIAVLLFIFIDFIVGLIVSFRIRKVGFISEKAWQTVYKLIGAEICVVLAWVLDTHVITFTSLYLANIFAGIICGVDLWSIVTNFAILSNHPAFRLIKKWGKSEIENKVPGLIDFDELEKKEDKKQ